MTESGRAGGRQLLGTAVAPGYANSGYAVSGGGEHVERAIADHDRGQRPHNLARHHVGDQIGFVIVGAVELRSAYRHEMTVQTEARQDRPGVVVRLGGGHEQTVTAAPQSVECLGHTVVDDGVVHAAIEIAFAVVADRLLDALGRAEQHRKRDAERRSDQPQQLVCRRHGVPELAQGILNGADQARFRIDQGAVQIDQDVHANVSPIPRISSLPRASPTPPRARRCGARAFAADRPYQAPYLRTRAAQTAARSRAKGCLPTLAVLATPVITMTSLRPGSTKIDWP